MLVNNAFPTYMRPRLSLKGLKYNFTATSSINFLDIKKTRREELLFKQMDHAQLKCEDGTVRFLGLKNGKTQAKIMETVKS